MTELSAIPVQRLKEIEAKFFLQPENVRTQLLLEPFIAASQHHKLPLEHARMLLRLAESELNRDDAGEIGSTSSMSAKLVKDFLTAGTINTEELVVEAFGESQWISSYFDDAIRILENEKRLKPLAPLSTHTVAGYFGANAYTAPLKFAHKLERTPARKASPLPTQAAGPLAVRTTTRVDAPGERSAAVTSRSSGAPQGRPALQSTHQVGRHVAEDEQPDDDDQLVTDGSLAFVLGAAGLTIVKQKLSHPKNTRRDKPSRDAHAVTKTLVKNELSKNVSKPTVAAPTSSVSSGALGTAVVGAVKRLVVEARLPTPPPSAALDAASRARDGAPRLLREPPIKRLPEEITLTYLRQLMDKLPTAARSAAMVAFD